MKADEFLKSTDFFNLTYQQQLEALDKFITYILYNKECARAPARDIETRKEEFTLSVSKQVEYQAQMLIEFIDYWTEHNEGGRKMRFEMHKVFNVSKRLKTWYRNYLKFNKIKQNGSRYNVGTQNHAAKLSDVIPGI